MKPYLKNCGFQAFSLVKEASKGNIYFQLPSATLTFVDRADYQSMVSVLGFNHPESANKKKLGMSLAIKNVQDKDPEELRNGISRSRSELLKKYATDVDDSKNVEADI